MKIEHFFTEKVYNVKAIVIDCEYFETPFTTSCRIKMDKWLLNSGILLLLKETFSNDRFKDKGSYVKNIEGLMAYKKSCGSMTKYTTQSIPHALIQVK